jgi:tRNA dimethylallyltransferase
MAKIEKTRVPVLLGPTAAGKSAIALRIAEELELEIISCDSRQVYRHLDIGTAKPTLDEQKRVRHWLIDIIDPDAAFSAHQFAAMAREIIRDRAQAGRRVLLCGGTGFYFKALSRGLGPVPGRDPELRKRFEKKAREEGAASIFTELASVDPVAARKLHPHNVQKCIRALEVCYSTGKRFSDFQNQTELPDDLTFAAITVSLPRPELYRRINERVDAMARNGLWEEFLSVRQRGYDQHSPGLRCVGYQELFAVEKGAISFEETLDLIKLSTRHYAKRQLTWLRHQVPGKQFNADTDFSIIKEWISGIAGSR